MRRFLILLATSGLISAPAWAQDPVKVAGKQCEVAFENDYVRVLHWTTSPHETAAMHEHPAMVTVSLSTGKTRFTTPDGKSQVAESKPGQAKWTDPEKHSSEDLSDKKGEVIQVELKKKPGAAMTALSAAEDSVKVDPKHYHAEFQNDRVRVVRIKYGPNEKSVMHAHPAAVAVYLTDGKAKMTLPDGKTSMNDIKPGQIQWTEAQKHLPENTGGKPFELVLVELR
jgi:quercetin dioxygenase-like cupin family protein